MKGAPVVLIDVDGVLAEFNGAMLALLNSIQGTALGFPQDLPEPNTWDWFEPAGFTAATKREAWDFVTEHPLWWYRLAAYPETRAFLVALYSLYASEQVNPYFVTSRPSANVAPWTRFWLENHGFAAPNVIVVKTGTKHLVAKAVGAVAVLDDHGPNFRGMDTTVECYLVDRLWNRDDDCDHRITSLHEFLAAVRGPQELTSFAA
jgi:hypothetical protein